MQRLIPLLQELEDKLQRDLIILETGCTAHSTEHICNFIKNSKYEHDYVAISIDTLVCEEYLETKSLLDYVYLSGGDSLNLLKLLHSPLDFVLLNTDYSLQEYLLIERFLYPHAIVCIDNAKSDDCKILPYVEQKGFNVSWIEDRIIVIKRIKQ